MKKSSYITAISIFIFFFIFISTTCQNTDTSKPSNSLVGSWRALGGVDSTGKIKEYYIGEVGYHIFLEDGTFLTLGFRKNFPQTGVKPTTLEEYEEITENSWGRICTYTVDEENQKFHAKYIFDLNPKNMGNGFTMNYKVEGDTMTAWPDKGKTFLKSVRVKKSY